MTAQGEDVLAFPPDSELCSDGYPAIGRDFGLLCNESVTHVGNHRALAEIWPGRRRYVVWTEAGVVLPDVEEQR